MQHLSSPDLRKVLGTLEEIYTLRDASAFPAHIAATLSRLVPSDLITHCTADVRKGRFFNVPHPADFPFAQVDDPRLFDYPIPFRHPRMREGRAARLSDLFTPVELERQWWYNECWQTVGIRHQMNVGLHFRPPHSVGLSLNRSRRDFSERDRLILNLVRPHLVQASRAAEAITRLQQDLALVERGVEARRAGFAVMAADGHVRLLTPRVRQWLAAYFDAWPSGGDRLPETLQRWIQQEGALRGRTDDVPPPRVPLLVERDGKRLVVRLLADDAQSLLLLEEQWAGPEPRALERFGLTRREAEVLAWVAEGKTNAEIGQILGARPRTVEKHLERIFQKLGVETRTAAARVVLGSPPVA